MLTNFFKYQSLGNDFIVFDWYKKAQHSLNNVLNDVQWPKVVRKLCDRNFGIGADGVLVIKKNQEHDVAQMLIFNSDGSAAQSCLNGVRCIAQHLFSTHCFPKKFSIKLGNRLIECVVSEVNGKANPTIATSVGTACYEGTRTIQTTVGSFSGHVVDVGNPHFIIFQKEQLSWLERHGSVLEQHKAFPNRTNVEFVWQDEHDKKKYYLNVYERGCGVTRACSSGAAAFAGLLKQLDMINVNEQITVCMPGGHVTALVQEGGNIILQASAIQVFQGTLSKI